MNKMAKNNRGQEILRDTVYKFICIYRIYLSIVFIVFIYLLYLSKYYRGLKHLSGAQQEWVDS